MQRNEPSIPRSSRSFSRRRFLKVAAGAALAAPVVVPASALGAAGKAAPSERIGIGMIGLGREAIHKNLPAFLRHPLSQVTALCDVDRWRLEQQWQREELKGCSGTTDFRELLDRPEVDGVMITTPDQWHVPNALAAERFVGDDEANGLLRLPPGRAPWNVG